MLTAFWVVGGFGAVLFIVSMVLGDILDGIFDSLDGALDGVTGGLLSTASVAGFAGAFGLAGGTFMATTNASFGVSVIVGLVAGIAMAALSIVVTRAMTNAATDRTPGADDIVGATGTVITAIPADSFGEVVLQVGGHRLKRAARADQAIAAGASVTVTHALTSTSVRVTPVS